MFRVLKNAVWFVMKSIPSLVVFVALGALAWWGSKNDWKLDEMAPILARTKKETADAKEEEKPQNPSHSPGEIELASPEAAGLAGITTDKAIQKNDASLDPTITAPGVLAFDPDRYAQPTLPVSGSAWRILVSPGKRVSKGEVLALVASPDAGKLRSEFLSAWVQSDIKATQLQRLEAAGGAVQERQIRDAKEVLREARLGMFNAQQALANIGLSLESSALRGLSDEDARNRVRLLGVPGSLHREPDLPGTLVPLVSPISGQVVRRDLTLGELIGPGQTPFVIASNETLNLLVDVRQEDVERLVLGQGVTFRSAASGQTASGTLTWISSEVDPKTRTVKVRADVYNADGKLRPATFGTAEIKVGTSVAVSVPAAAVQWDGKSHRVFIRRDEKSFEPRFVLTGTSRNNRTELLDPRVLLGASLPGQFTACGGVWLALGSGVAAVEVFVPLAAGDSVATTGSQALKSEMLKSRIAGEE